MRPRWLIFIAVTQIAAVSLSLAGGLRNRLLGQDPNAMFMILGTNLALVAVLLTLRIQLDSDATQNALLTLTTALGDLRNSRAELKAMLDSAFYKTFETALREARVGVAITHLDTRPPTLRRGTPAEHYYTNLCKLIKNSPATFRRVERLSRDKIPWLQKHISEYEGVRNFSLSVIMPPYEDRKLPHVSVQLIDSHTCILVAVAEHEGTHGPRDIWMRDEDSTLLWKNYYDAILWRQATKLIENGSVDHATWDRLKQELERA